jgi:hypothetical protein
MQKLFIFLFHTRFRLLELTSDIAATYSGRKNGFVTVRFADDETEPGVLPLQTVSSSRMDQVRAGNLQASEGVV